MTPPSTSVPVRPSLRPARAAEAALVREISAEAFVPAYLPVIGTAPRPATEDYAPRIERGEVHLLEDAGQAVGVLVVEPQADHLVVYSLAVRPSAQGRGLGKALLAFAAALAREAGLPELRLYTNTRMTRNIALYRACGYVETGTRPHPVWPGQRLIDMSLRLTPAGAGERVPSPAPGA